MRLLRYSNMETCPGSTSPVVLVVEDEAEIRELIREILEGEGHRALLASDGDEALELAGHDPPDMILLDVVMRRVDALAFSWEYRRRGGSAPIVLLTATSSVDAEAAVDACGAVGYIPKPFDIDAVLRAIADLATRDDGD